MTVIAHIGKIPVEEWLPFLVPVIGLYLYGRRWTRRRHEAIARLPGPTAPLDEQTVEQVLAGWTRANHRDVAREQLAILYPPGPDGCTPSELAKRIRSDPASVRRRLDELADLGYLDIDEAPSDAEPQVWLTAQGLDLANVTEETLLSALTTPATQHEEAG
jgi:hypothetical protein